MSLMPPVEKGVPPFDAARLDKLMEEAGLDCIVATSKHNVQYLLGGYRFFFYDTMEAMATSRYLPAVIYRKGRPQETTYVGCGMENFERENGRFWAPTLDLGRTGAAATAQAVVKHLQRLGLTNQRVGVEAPFIPLEASSVLRDGLENRTLADAVVPLERLRAKKTPREIAQLTEASEKVVASMLATWKATKVGDSKAEIAERLRVEEVKRGLVFDYLLTTVGTSLNRSPNSTQTLAAGDIMSLDSGGNQDGYIGDVCRMAILGEPDAELVDLLGFVDAVQQAARTLSRPGTRGGDVIDVGERMVEASPYKDFTEYWAHGMGLVSHEAPRLMDNHRSSYTGYDKDRPLEAGMVLSIETTMQHPKRGFIKLEDTVLVTDAGPKGLGDTARGWNRIGR